MYHREKRRGVVRDGVQALVSDQVGLTHFWSDWQQQQRHFLATAHSGKLQGGAAQCQADETGASGDEGDTADDLATLLRETVLGESEGARSAPSFESGNDEGASDGHSEEDRTGPPSPHVNEAAREWEASTTGGRQSSRRRSRTEMSPASARADAEGEPREVLAPLSTNFEHRGDTDEKDEEREVLLQRIAELESRLVDTEVFLSTEPGTLIQDLESDLAKTKLKLAHAEAEKDELEVQLMNLKARAGAKGKENGTPGWFAAKARS